MPKKIDLSTVSPERAEQILRSRESKKREYERKREVILARNKAWQATNRDKTRSYSKKWRSENPERKRELTRSSYDRNRDKILAKERERQMNLVDSVVKGRFVYGTGLRNQDIPDEMVPMLRTTILIKRHLRKLKGKNQ